MIEPGATVAGHLVEELLGDNALTASWLVRAPSGEARVLRTLQLFLPSYQQRFRRASELLVGIDHPHLVRVFEVVDVDGIPGAIVERTDGGDLAEWIARGPHPPVEILRKLRGILAGVEAAHALGLLHRNLKPSMVLMSRGVPKVDDFALGKVMVSDDGDPHLTQAGTTFGTPQYMAPEQFRGAQLTDERSDLYAVGCVAYEMCTGRLAFADTDVSTLYAAVREGRCAPVASLRPDLPPALVRLVAELMQPDYEQRPDSARLVLDRIDADPVLSALLAWGSPVPGVDPNAATLPPTRGEGVASEVAAAPPTLPPTLPPTRVPDASAKRLAVLVVGVLLVILVVLAALLAPR